MVEGLFVFIVVFLIGYGFWICEGGRKGCLLLLFLILNCMKGFVFVLDFFLFENEFGLWFLFLGKMLGIYFFWFVVVELYVELCVNFVLFLLLRYIVLFIYCFGGLGVVNCLL